MGTLSVHIRTTQICNRVLPLNGNQSLHSPGPPWGLRRRALGFRGQRFDTSVLSNTSQAHPSVWELQSWETESGVGKLRHQKPGLPKLRRLKPNPYDVDRHQG